MASAISAIQLRGFVTSIKRSSCSGDANRSSATFRKIASFLPPAIVVIL
jgi:hypothetical protein